MSKVPPQVSVDDTISTRLRQLSEAALDLNAASDELSKPIAIWEATLKKLNLGVSAWAELSSSSTDENGYWWDRHVGYTRLNSRWRIALRAREGFQDETKTETWQFNEAPRWMRIEAVGAFPELLEALVEQARDTAVKIRKKTLEAQEQVAALGKQAGRS